MPNKERVDDELIALWAAWLRSQPRADVRCILTPKGIFVSFSVAASLLEAGDAFLIATFVEPLRVVAQALGEDPISEIPALDDAVVIETLAKIVEATDMWVHDADIVIPAEDAMMFNYAAHLLIVDLFVNEIAKLDIQKTDEGSIEVSVGVVPQT